MVQLQLVQVDLGQSVSEVSVRLGVSLGFLGSPSTSSTASGTQKRRVCGSLDSMSSVGPDPKDALLPSRLSRPGFYPLNRSRNNPGGERVAWTLASFAGSL
jgi:hypothetical protein